MIIYEWIFFVCFALLFYSYFGYPILLFLHHKIGKLPVLKKEGYFPSISIILPVYNEEKFVEEKIQNLLEQDYPLDQIEILIGSDGSTDRTNQILEDVNHKNIQIFLPKERRGKMGVLIDLVPRAKNEIILFTDVHELFEKNSIQKLIRNFADPKVGGVTGLHLFRKKDSTVAQGSSFYWKYERMIQRLESEIWTIHSSDGPIYAIRRELFQEPPPKIINDDDFIPLQVTLQGFRVVYETEALAYSDPPISVQGEMTTRIRFQEGHFQNYWHLWRAFIPFYSPIAFYYFSHKFLRSLTGFLLIGQAISSIFLIHSFPFSLFFWGQSVFYFLALIGLILERWKISFILFTVPIFFCLHGYASVVGFFRFLLPSKKVGWTKVEPGS